MRRYAAKGELVSCPNGHLIAELARDVFCDEIVDFQSQFIYRDATAPHTIPLCPICDHEWIVPPLNLFFINGKLRTLSALEETNYYAQMNKILKIIKIQPGVTRNILIKKTPKLGSDIRNQILYDLTHAGKIKSIPSRGKTKSVETFYLC